MSLDDNQDATPFGTVQPIELKEWHTSIVHRSALLVVMKPSHGCAIQS
jgi:hypothetical protein